MYVMDRDELLAEIKRLNVKLERVIGEAGRLENRYTDGHELLQEALGIPLEPKNEPITLAGKIYWLRDNFPEQVNVLKTALETYVTEHPTKITWSEWYQKTQKAWWDIE